MDMQRGTFSLSVATETVMTDPQTEEHPSQPEFTYACEYLAT